MVALLLARVAELADAPDLGSGTERCGGSIPSSCTPFGRELGGTQPFASVCDLSFRGKSVSCTTLILFGNWMTFDRGSFWAWPTLWPTLRAIVMDQRLTVPDFVDAKRALLG